MKKYIYFFGREGTEGRGSMKELLGGKGANLADMADKGVPVPPGFTITTEVCTEYYEKKGKLSQNFDVQYQKAIKKLEKVTGKKFGDSKNPLLVSVRSGAKFSMPGMMDTVLNLGLNDETVLGLIEKTGNPRFAYDSYRRFIQMFGDVVMGVEKALFEEILTAEKERLGIVNDTGLSEDDLKELIKKYKEFIKKEKGVSFPTDPLTQLQMSRDAVFRSWNNPRAKTYRKLNKIPDEIGTAVNIQAMVFGNMGDDSATGVGFTRNPSTGENKFYGEYLINAQGEDVVAGVRTPQPIEKLEKEMPKVYKELRKITSELEKRYKDVQDFEFTIEQNKLYMLQTRNGKRTTTAAVKIAVDMVRERLITKEEALMRVAPDQLDQLLHPIIDPKAKYEILTTGLPASPGAAVGKVVFDSDEASEIGEKEPVILVRMETCPDDIHGMHSAQGILTARGGMTSHAAVVARGMGKCCVAGCGSLKIDEKKGTIKIKDITIKKGDWLTLNGSTGEVIIGKVETVEPKLTGDFAKFMKWTDEIRIMSVRANADVPHDAAVAIDFGAEGIGLCRTEHMFFDQKRLPFMQKMILAEDEDTRRKALKKLLPFQKEDFKGLFETMKGHPVTVRLLDPPLHEFLPKTKIEAKELSKRIGITEEKIWKATEDLHEFNPMLGHRGCRLGIAYPEITEMQTEAIISAVCELAEKKIKIVPEIMIPLIGHINEFRHQKEIVVRIAEETMKKYDKKIEYHVGTMIEVPRAAITADEIAREAEFFSFGTNDLTQMGMGLSRDDAGKFIKIYIDNKIYSDDPFQTLDQDGVGKLVQIGLTKGRSVKPDLKVGICGEHGGDPESVKFFHRAGLSYVSCSPYRIPIARLSAAQAQIETPRNK